VLICGASFAGLTVARELAGSGAHVLVIDRYEIGERQTSACAAPTAWLETMGLGPSMRQSFDTLVIHTPHTTARMRLPWTFSTFDYRELCESLWAQCEAEFETATVRGRVATNPAAPGRGSSMEMPEAKAEGVFQAGAEEAAGNDSEQPAGICVQTDRGVLSAHLVVDALGWRRVLAADGEGFQPPEAPLSRGLEVHPHGAGEELEIWIDRGYVPAGYSWSFPATDEVRVGVGSFDPRFHVKQPTVRLADDLGREAVRYQGNWIPHKLRPATESDVFFVGDSAGHCLPLTAEGIRTAFYFGIACGRELRAAVEGHSSRDRALERYQRFSDSHEWKFRWMLRTQRAVPRVPPRLLAFALNRMESRRFVHWSFDHYLNIAPPSFARASGQPGTSRPKEARLPALARR
jgi:digeranylgeranylglycerophospholipid reductase